MVYFGDGNKGNLHETQLRVTAALLKRGKSVDETVKRMLAETHRVADYKETSSDWWVEEERLIRQMCHDFVRKNPDLLETAYPQAAAIYQSREKTTAATAAEPAPINLWAKGVGPALPRRVLPAVIENFVIEHGVLMGADPAGLAVGALIVCAGMIPDFIKLRVKHHDTLWRESARLWATLVGPPSTKRTPVLHKLTHLVNKFDVQLERQYQCNMEAYDAAVKAERKIKPLHKRLCMEDSTIEGARDLIFDNAEGMLLVQDELSAWFGGMEKYQKGQRGIGADRSFWLRSYNGGSYSFNRAGHRGGIIENLSVSLLGGIQPTVARRFIGSGEDDGLWARIMPIMMLTVGVGKDEETATPSLKNYEQLLERLFGKRQAAPEMYKGADLELTPEAQAFRYQREIKHHEMTKDYEIYNGKLASHFGKYDGVFARLCLTFAIIEHNSPWPLPHIDIDVARRVAQFMDQFLVPHAEMFYMSQSAKCLRFGTF